jgi:hypothetical protein
VQPWHAALPVVHTALENVFDAMSHGERPSGQTAAFGFGGGGGVAAPTTAHEECGGQQHAVWSHCPPNCSTMQHEHVGFVAGAGGDGGGGVAAPTTVHEECGGQQHAVWSHCPPNCSTMQQEHVGFCCCG